MYQNKAYLDYLRRFKIELLNEIERKLFSISRRWVKFDQQLRHFPIEQFFDQINACRWAKSVRFIQLSSADKIITKPQVYEVQEGGRVVLDCELRDNPTDLRTLWTKIKKDGNRETVYVGNFPLSKDEHYGKRFENNSLEIINANKDDEGSYECLLTIVDSSGGEAKVTHKLVIQYKPTIDENPQEITVLENNQVNIDCEADGVPKPTVLWERKGKVPPGFNKESAKNSFIADPDLSGQYYCTATNSLGSVSRITNVNVRFAPEVVISEQMDSQQPTIRTVICTVRANPKPEYVNLYKVGSGGHAKTYETIEYENKILNEYTRSFTVRDEKDFGEYICESKNEHGENRKSHNVTMERPKPEKVQLVNYPPNGVMDDSSELEWSIKSQFDINKFEIVVSKLVQATPSSVKSVVQSDTVKPKQTEENEYQGSLPLNTLEPGNTFSILIRAVNSYDQKSEIEVDVHLQKSSSSSANQSVLCIFLILALNFFHFRNTRLH